MKQCTKQYAKQCTKIKSDNSGLMSLLFVVT